MRSVSHPDVYAVGDAAFAHSAVGTPLRMSCASGVPMAWQAADSIVARLTGGKLPHTPLTLREPVHLPGPQGRAHPVRHRRRPRAVLRPGWSADGPVQGAHLRRCRVGGRPPGPVPGAPASHVTTAAAAHGHPVDADAGVEPPAPNSSLRAELVGCNRRVRPGATSSAGRSDHAEGRSRSRQDRADVGQEAGGLGAVDQAVVERHGSASSRCAARSGPGTPTAGAGSPPSPGSPPARAPGSACRCRRRTPRCW